MYDEQHPAYWNDENSSPWDHHQPFRNPSSSHELGLTTALAGVTRQYETLEHTSTELERRIQAMTHELAAYREQQTQLQKAFDTFRTAHTRDRSMTTTNIHGLHLHLAREHRAFIEQRLNSLARRILSLDDQHPGVQTQHQVAKVIMRLSTLLFPHGPLSAEHVPRILPETFPSAVYPRISQETAAADALYRRIVALNSTQNRVRFDYAFVAGSTVDPAGQEAWPPCDGDAPVSFVLAPAYLVGDDIYQRQLVYTRPESRRRQRRRRRSRPLEHQEHR
ncbi:hypothetical protein [Catenulispora rubra]|uniref:hypothetical protein n=1 Tax=Catenulispora rubra TaxID=280293 RepID=UPI00189230B2|nr:hypothetical protein [Catenulispora rubra]